jgi:hypothetical protein
MPKKPNIAKLEKVYTFIEAHQDRWDQSVWRELNDYDGPAADVSTDRCKTAMCFAGWAVELDGCRWLERTPGEHGDLLLARKSDSADEVFFIGGKPLTTALRRARQILGLSHQQAGNLFSGDNSLKDIRAFIDALKAESSTTAVQ